MRVYLAARHNTNDEMRGVRDVLESLGHDVELVNLPQVFGIEELAAADLVIPFASENGGDNGERHVEHGLIPPGPDKRIIVCGPRENVFHILPQVEWYPDWSRFVMALTGESDEQPEGSR